MNKMKITLERKLITYSDLWRTSEVLLEKAKAEPQGSYYLILGSLTFSAFALEAFLNHLGENIFGSWIDLESISPRAKLNVICERIKINPSLGRPAMAGCSRDCRVQEQNSPRGKLFA
jgi:hypothetical protein